MIANVVVFTYRGRVKKRDIRIQRGYLGEDDFLRVVSDTESLFGKADAVQSFEGVDLRQRGADLAYDLERLSGRNPKKTSPS